MGGKRIGAAYGVLAGAGLLAGCCLLSGSPTVTINGPSTATTGTAVTFTANASGGSQPYTYAWGFGGSGATVTHTFTSPGQQTIGVTVIDNCGKQASAVWTVTVSEGTGGGGSLTGMWNGTIYDNQGNNLPFALQITHVGTSVSATVTVDFGTSTGTGSYAAGQFMLQFQWPRTTTTVLLQGTYNPYAGELSGDWMIGGIRIGTWRVRR